MSAAHDREVVDQPLVRLFGLLDHGTADNSSAVRLHFRPRPSYGSRPTYCCAHQQHLPSWGLKRLTISLVVGRVEDWRRDSVGLAYPLLPFRNVPTFRP